MKTSERPEWLDFQVFRLVKIELHSLRSAAESLQMPEVQVGEMLSRVDDFLVAGAAGADDEEQRRKQLRVSEQIAAERIDFLQRQATNGFRLSQQLDKKAAKNGGPAFSPGNPKFLLAAARLALMAAKLPPPRLEIMALLGNQPESSDQPETDENTPNGACSPPLESVAVARPEAADAFAVNSSPESVSVAGVSPELLAKLPRTGPVQLDGSGCEERVGRRAFFAGLATG